MRARVVDWALLALVLVGILTGLWSFLIGDPDGRWLFITHGALGIALLGVLAAKLRRVTPLVITPKAQRLSMVIGILTAIAALATVGIGLWWMVAQTPVAYPNGMILHTTFAFILLGLTLWHFLLRFRPLTHRDVQDRRSLLRLTGILAGGTVLWAGVETAQHAIGTTGSRRRFTGSRREASTLPVTMWMFDQVPTFDLDHYALEVGGEVTNPLRIRFDQLAQLPQTEIMATLDCTGGWYSEQEWRGISVGSLLQMAQPMAGATYVRFRSATGYRWSFPLAEAAELLLATHIGAQPLDVGHGAPVRLVAPGRRGFQWVKWVVAVEALDAPDLGQWGAIFTSGLDGDL